MQYRLTESWRVSRDTLKLQRTEYKVHGGQGEPFSYPKPLSSQQTRMFSPCPVWAATMLCLLPERRNSVLTLRATCCGLVFVCVFFKWFETVLFQIIWVISKLRSQLLILARQGSGASTYAFWEGYRHPVHNTLHVESHCSMCFGGTFYLCTRLTKPFMVLLHADRASVSSPSGESSFISPLWDCEAPSKEVPGNDSHMKTGRHCIRFRTGNEY